VKSKTTSLGGKDDPVSDFPIAFAIETEARSEEILPPRGSDFPLYAFAKRTRMSQKISLQC